MNINKNKENKNKDNKNKENKNKDKKKKIKENIIRKFSNYIYPINKNKEYILGSYYYFIHSSIIFLIGFNGMFSKNIIHLIIVKISLRSSY